MTRTSRYRVTLFAVSLLVSCALVSAHASAAIDLFVGTRMVVQNQPVDDCNTKAKAALGATLTNVVAVGDTNQWVGSGPPVSGGLPSAAAVIHCFPVGTGYVVTMTCTVEVPPNPEVASALCARLTTAFGGTTP